MLRYLVGVLVRSTTCKRLTNSLPKLSLITLVPLKRRDIRSAGYTAHLCQYPSHHFLGIPGRVYFKFDMAMGKI